MAVRRLPAPRAAATDKNTRLIPAAQQKITAAEQQLTRVKTALDKVPARLPANQIDPGGSGD